MTLLLGGGRTTLTVRSSPKDSAEDKLRHHGWKVIDSGCWEWMASRDRKNYGHVSFLGRLHRAHRLAYETWVGPIPEGHVVRHKCDNPPCINPEHLETGTHSDNALDRESRNRGRNQVGEKSSTAKLTEQDVLDIRAEYATGQISQSALAEFYGVTKPAIRYVIQRRTWRHIW